MTKGKKLKIKRSWYRGWLPRGEGRNEKMRGDRGPGGRNIKLEVTTWGALIVEVCRGGGGGGFVQKSHQQRRSKL